MTHRRRIGFRRQTLALLQPAIEAGVQTVFDLGRFSLVIGLTIFTLLMPPPPGLSADGHRALALFVFTGGILALEPVPLPIAALMVPVMQVVLGIANVTDSFAPFSSPVVFLILGSLFLAEALSKHGLSRRLALWAIARSGGKVSLLLLSLMIIAATLSFWVINTATAAVLIPVASAITRQVPDPARGRRLLVLLIMGIAVAASVGGMGTIMGAAPNAVAADWLTRIGPWTFLDWTKFGMPAAFLLLPLSWWLLLRIIPVGIDRLDLEGVNEEITRMNSLSRHEVEILVIIGISAVLWVTGSYLENALALPETLLSSAIIAIGAVFVMSIRLIIDWDDIKGVSWGLFFIIGAGLSLGEALERTGTSAWFAQILMPVARDLPAGVILALLVIVSAILTNLLNNATIAAVFTPVLIDLSRARGLDPIFLILPATLATTFGYSLPSASARMALIYGTGVLTRNEMMRYGILLTLPSAAVLIGFFLFLSLLNWI
jgi:sodium-dependent dicarboxylate transporter 2/3/5